jgi:hypothetical protein
MQLILEKSAEEEFFQFLKLRWAYFNSTIFKGENSLKVYGVEDSL